MISHLLCALVHISNKQSLGVVDLNSLVSESALAIEVYCCTECTGREVEEE